MAQDGAVSEPANPLPRELAPGIFWLGTCLKVSHHGRPLHGYNSVYLVTGADRSMLVEAGHAPDLQVIEGQLDELMRTREIPPLRYLFTTHTEAPHSSGLGRLLDRYPDTIVCGDTLDLHLVFPQHADRFRAMDPGDALDLGGTEFVALAAVIRDMPYTRWGFDSSRRVLFPGDGFAYSHYHEGGHCGSLAEEAPTLALPDMTALFAELALYWTQFADLEPYIARLDELLRELDVALIAPTHGLPIADLEATVPKIYDGLRLGGGIDRGPVLGGATF
jgi:flavorubredoxin